LIDACGIGIDEYEVDTDVIERIDQSALTAEDLRARALWCRHAVGCTLDFGGRVQLFGEPASSSRYRFHVLLVENHQFEQACPFDLIVEAP
jgi:hypothetical protein